MVRIDAANIPATATRATVDLIPVTLGTACGVDDPRVLKVDAAVAPVAVTFAVPPKAPLGRYHVCVSLTGVEGPPMSPPGTRPFRIQSSAVSLTGITPAGAYPDGDAYTFWVDGEGFSPIGAENVLIIDGHATQAELTPQPPEKVAGDANASTDTGADQRDSRDLSEPRQLWVKIAKLDDNVRGKRQIQIRVGTQLSGARPIVLSWAARWTPQAVAAIAVGIIVLLLVVLIVRGLRSLGTNRPSVLAALLLENGAYSLGKLQFYAWTLVAVLGYLFLAFARSLVQGHPDLPEVPGGLPGLVGISAGTGVLSAAIGAISSTKGPAGTKPSIADLIVTGGSVVVDRVQFLVWTFVSIVAFITVVSKAEPATIETLPVVPNGLLYLMGLSAGGYLGGKFLRRPVPDIQEVVGRDDQANRLIQLTVKGRNLSKEPSIMVNGQVIAPKSSGAPVHFEPIDATVPEPGSGSELFQQLSIKVHYETPLLQPSGNQLVLVNPDGQSAKGEIKVGAGGRTDVWERPLRVF